MRTLDINKNDRLLIVAPHPDDESIGTGGLLSLYPDQSEILLATDGAQCLGKLKHREMSEKRICEFEEVMASVGTKHYRKLMFPNGELIYHPECFDDVDFSGYTKIFVPYFNEVHSDHMAVFEYVVANIRKLVSGKPQIYMYETRMPLENVTHYLDLSGVIENKLKMIATYKSQNSMYNYVEFSRTMTKFQACRFNQPEKYYETYTKIELENIEDRDIETIRELADYRRKNEYFEKWLQIVASGKRVSFYARKKWKDKNIAIYGYGLLGRVLYQDFNNSGYKPKCVLDKNAGKFMCKGLDIRYPEKKFDDIDVVIVTNMVDLKHITSYLEEHYETVVTLWDLMVETENDLN